MAKKTCLLCRRFTDSLNDLCKNCKKSIHESYAPDPLFKTCLGEVNLTCFHIFDDCQEIRNVCKKAKRDKRAASFLKNTMENHCFYKLAVCGATNLFTIKQNPLSRFNLEVDLNYFLAAGSLKYISARAPHLINSNFFFNKKSSVVYKNDSDGLLYSGSYGLIICETIKDLSIESLKAISLKLGIFDIMVVSIY